MGLRAILNELQLQLESYFVSTNNEWVSISLEAATRLDIKIVSNKTKNKKESEEFIRDKVEFLNTKSQYMNLLVGFLEFYTIDEAEIFEIEKPLHKNKNVTSFGDIIDILSEPKFQKNKRKAKVISFYSYKGGVGRTVSLIQSAYNLAKKGKKVILIDLDIEAPSFNAIFRDDIKNSNGLLDYLFNKYSKNESKIYENYDVSSVVSKLNLNIKGEIYVVPCGNIDIKYVKDLQLIKESVIYENNYIGELIDKIVEEYNADYVFIDSRTGINNWGALAITDIADEVFLVAYPNYENYEGIKLILDLIKDEKKCTVIFSRIDPSIVGKKNALDLFNKLKLNQNFISIYYDAKIAINNKYPMEDIDSFNDISEFILEEEEIIQNKQWIDNNPDKVRNILTKTIDNNNLKSIITNNENKITNKSNSILVVDNNIDILELLHNIDKTFRVNFLDKYYLNSYENLLKNTDISASMKISNLLLSTLIVFIENLVSNKEFLEKDFNEKVTTIYNKITSDTKNPISITETLTQLDQLDNKNNDISNYILLDFKDIYYILNKLNEHLTPYIIITIISLAIKSVNLKSYINTKLLVDIEYYNKFKEDFDKYNSDLLELSWKTDNNKERLTQNIKELLNLSENIILSDNTNINNLKELTILKELTGESNDILINRNLLYCKRININKYSQELNYYISEIIKTNENLSKKYVLNLIKSAAQIELDNLDNNIDKYSIIGIDSFKKVLT